MSRADPVSHSVAREFSALSFAWRFVAALALILLTYNPSTYSYFHWVREAVFADTFGALHVFAGVVLVIGWVIYLAATFDSMGVLGMVLTAALMAAFVWLLVEWGVLVPDTGSEFAWIVLVCLAFLLAVGLSWAHIWRRLTGQFDTDE